ncbi:thiamine pyrophosphate-binding protein [Rhodococcus triatomae]|uniref:acetolactate synthase n=1 Tax=Rhodococcus triatomae TaxID=300028 RepID=A0A1G8BAC1_9NOCA|nr:thiamine pyrophosphate-binding protein [Rhodococcus triatomae]QNG17501.1 thiamine pyrophosphate-binding protein [Rhodococcus triatomae]QNG22831.1 thiamine pyrophosphate-binding protein [Rhodococcus triatomae]SDH30118.1 acetolactate synthase-1/2/3 large subunit [Rhodococcus triatomae]
MATGENTTPKEPTGGDVLVEVMRRHGVDTAFGVISIHNLPLVEAVARELNFVEVRHEAAAVNAADGYARASGGIGVAITSTGTGAGNAAGSMLEALTAGSRVLHVTGQIESEYLGDAVADSAGDRGVRSVRGVIHEVPRQLQMLDAVSKYASTIGDAKGVEAELEAAIAQILAAPQGPASVEWPSDLQYLARPDEQRPAEATATGLAGSGPGTPDPSAVAEAVRLLQQAKRPLIWVGGGAAGAGGELTRILHTLGAGLLTSNSGRAIVPEDDELVIGNFAANPGVAALLGESDLLLSVGTHFRSNETKSYHLSLPSPRIQIDVDPAAIGRVYPADVGIVADAAQALAAISAGLTTTSVDEDWAAKVTATRTSVRADLTEYIGGYAEICEGLRAQLPRESVVARDVTIPSSQWGNRLFPFYERETNVFPLGGGIGQGLAMGIGAAHARPDVPTVVIAGDGGLAVHLGELASLAGSRAWCVVLVFNDGGYGVLRNMQEANGFDRAGVDLYTPRFDLLAASLEVPYALVQGPGQFEKILADAVATRGPAIVEVDVAAISPTPGAFTPPVHIPVREG